MTERSDAEDIDLQCVGARLAARAQIRDVRLLRTQAAVHRAPQPSQGLSYDIEFESKSGRKIVLHERDRELRKARSDWAADPELRDKYRKYRPNVERVVSQIANRG